MWIAAAWMLTSLALPAFAWASGADDDEPKLDAVIVTATRSPGLIRNEPLRVEAVPAEEIEENLTVQPGNLSSLLHELPGVRMQSAGPSLGGTGLQLRGMPARDTLVLTDGLPSFGAEPDAFGLLQSPPLDLERVEVIKGAASALYGASALGGVLNLVSRNPDAEPELLANATSRGARDLVGFFTHHDASAWSGTLTAGAHDQSREDVNGDGWADLAGYRRITLRPRVWWKGPDGRSLFVTAGVVDEDRMGGTLANRLLPNGGAFPEELRTRRFDAGAVSRLSLDDGGALNGRISVTSSHLDRTFDVQRIASSQITVFGEEAMNGVSRGHSWVLGAAFTRDQLAVGAVPGVSYTYNVPSVFAQDTVALAKWMVVAGSLRVDANSEYGAFVSPRVSALLRRGASPWSLRASVGGGYSPPTPFLEEIEDTGLGTLLPLRGLHAERAVTESLDARWADRGWDVNISLFNSEIRDGLEVLPTGSRLQLSNASGPRRAPGAEALIGYTAGALHVLGSWSTIHATQVDPGGLRHDVPLVPRQAGSLDAILEVQRRGRVGLEVDYTGTQGLEYDPYRTMSRAYFSFNALAEVRFQGVAVFMNVINFSNVRQTRWDPLIRPSPGPGGNPITDVWAPLDGRTLNVGIRAEL